MVNVATTTMENLLRVARGEAAGGTAFAALLGDGSPAEIFSVPATGTPESLTSEELAALVRQAASDPEFLHARVFVRSVHVGQSLMLAVAPLRDAEGQGMVGVVAPSEHQFGPEQLDVLERLAQRVLRHLQVVRRLSVGEGLGDPPGARAADTDGEVGPLKGVAAPLDRWPEPPVVRDAAGVPPEGPEGPGGAGDAADRAIGAPGDGSPEGWAAMWAARSPAMWWAANGPFSGLSGLGQFFSRAGRMLASGDDEVGALALVVVEVPDPRTTPSAAQALRVQLRFSDLLAGVDADLLAVAVMLLPTATGDAVEERLAAAVRSGLERPGDVRAVHVVATPGDRREVDELLRDAVSRLRGRS